MVHGYMNEKNEEKVTVFFEGEAHEVPKGISVAAAVLGHFHSNQTCVNNSTGQKRGPHCLMGVCFDCMVEIDGLPNQQGCLVMVKNGMRIERQGALWGEE